MNKFCTCIDDYELAHPISSSLFSLLAITCWLFQLAIPYCLLLVAYIHNGFGSQRSRHPACPTQPDPARRKTKMGIEPCEESRSFE